VDVRVLGATNRDLSQAVAERTFRADLLARLAGVEVSMPPLRERTEDLPALSSFLLKRSGRAGIRVSADALEAMMLYDWPQNIRELDNALRTASLGGSDEIALLQLPARVREPLRVARETGASKAATEADDVAVVPGKDDQRRRLDDALRKHGGNVRRASMTLGIARGHLYRLLDRWQIDLSAYRDDPRDPSS
jgi:DNA-binding NtrC family response regulator